jgi:hypothetical protein
MRAEHHRDHVRATIKGRETECPTDRTPRPWTQLAWNAERRPQKKPHNPCPRTGGSASSYPLAQHQYRNEVPQHHHRDLPSSQAVCHSSVLNHQHSCGCGKFGTKRPQVQILSPRLYSRRSEALTRVGEGLSCGQYSSKIRQVQQRRRDLTCSSKMLPPACAALRAGRRGRRFKSCHPDQCHRSLTCGNAACARDVPPPSNLDRGLEERKGTPGKPDPTSTGRRTPGLPARPSRPRGTAASFRAL